ADGCVGEGGGVDDDPPTIDIRDGDQVALAGGLLGSDGVCRLPGRVVAAIAGGEGEVAGNGQPDLNRVRAAGGREGDRGWDHRGMGWVPHRLSGEGCSDVRR